MYPAQVWTAPPEYGSLDVRWFQLPANDPHGPGPKPFGGLWTSTYHPGHLSEWACDEACHAREGDWLKAWVLLAPSARLWVIDRFEDLAVLVERYPVRCDCGVCGMNSDLAAAAGVLLPSLQHPMDVEAMEADGWDGIWVTRRGVHECRLPQIDHGIDAPNLYSWDVECTYWLRWVFTEVRYLGIFRSPERQASPQDLALDRLMEHVEQGCEVRSQPEGIVCERHSALLVPLWMVGEAANG